MSTIFNKFLVCKPDENNLMCMWIYIYYQVHIATINNENLKTLTEYIESNDEIFSILNNRTENIMYLKILNAKSDLMMIKNDVKIMFRIIRDNEESVKHNMAEKAFQIIEYFERLDYDDIEKIVMNEITYSELKNYSPMISLKISLLLSSKYFSNNVRIDNYIDLEALDNMNRKLENIEKMVVSELKNGIGWFDELIEDAILIHGENKFFTCYELAKVASRNNSKPYHEILGCSGMIKTVSWYIFISEKIKQFINNSFNPLEFKYIIRNIYKDNVIIKKVEY